MPIGFIEFLIRIGKLPIAALELLVELPQLFAHPIQIGRQIAELVAVRHADFRREIARRDLAEARRHLANWTDQRPRDRVAEEKRQRDAADGKPDDYPPGN